MKPLTLAILAVLSAGAQATERVAAPAQAQAQPATDAAPAPRPDYLKPSTLDTLKVIGQRLFPYQEGMVLNEGYLKDQVKGNGDIGTLLRINPNVQFDDNAMTSRNMGEIRPTDISINGGLYYQNAFLLNGASFNSDLDPASNNPNHFADPPSHTQGIAVNANMLGSLTVYDSNVPAGYGGFNGGVIVAESRKAKDGLAGELTYRMTRSQWNDVYINEKYQTLFDQSSSAANQPQYDKTSALLSLEGRTAAGIGLIGNISWLRSNIPLRGQSSGLTTPYDAATKEQTRQNLSYSLQGDWSNGRNLDIEASLSYSPTDERYFIQNAKDSWFDLKSGGPLASLRATYRSGAWTWKNTLSYVDLEDSRTSDRDYWFSWRWSPDKNWATSTTGLSTEGNWGSVDQTSRSVSYKLEGERSNLHWGDSRHTLVLGLEVSDREATYERLNDLHSYISPLAATTCTDARGNVDNIACSLSPVPALAGRGQYLSRVTTYEAGYFEAQALEWALFAHDDIRLGNWSFRPGVRIDGSDLNKQTTVAPRFAMSWDIFGSRNSLLTAGANRYYGRNLFAYKLRDGRDNLTLVQTRTATGANALVWGAPVRAGSSTRFEELDTPYSDEWMLGFNQKLGNFDVNFKYVNRDFRDEIMRVRVPSNDTSGHYEANVYEYQNVGRARSETYTLAIEMQRPWQWGQASTLAQLAFDHTDTRRAYTGAYQDYSTIYNQDTYNSPVQYEGAIIRFHELPASSYNRPWTARLATQTRWERWGLLWSNFLRYRAGYLDLRIADVAEHEGEPINVYREIPHQAGWTWDSTVEYAWKFGRSQEAYVRVEAINLTNAEVIVTGSSTDTNAVYEPGRTYWLELGYRF